MGNTNCKLRSQSLFRLSIIAHVSVPLLSEHHILDGWNKIVLCTTSTWVLKVLIQHLLFESFLVCFEQQ